MYDLDEILASQPQAAQQAIDQRYRELMSAFPLAELRGACALSQKEMAQILDVSQAAVSKLEARGDMRLSTLFRYVRALSLIHI